MLLRKQGVFVNNNRVNCFQVFIVASSNYINVLLLKFDILKIK